MVMWSSCIHCVYFDAPSFRCFILPIKKRAMWNPFQKDGSKSFNFSCNIFPPFVIFMKNDMRQSILLKTCKANCRVPFKVLLLGVEWNGVGESGERGWQLGSGVLGDV